MKHHARMAVVASLLFVQSIVVAATVQKPVESGVLVLTGRIISQRNDFHRPFTVQLYRESLVPLAEAIVRQQDHFTFSGLSGGAYIIVADVPGFKRIRERVDLNGQRRTNVVIFLEEERETVVERPLELMGREDLVVNVDDLAPRSPELIDEFERAIEDLQNGQVEAARLRLEEIVRKDPAFYDAHMWLGYAYQQMLWYRDAEAEFRNAADLRAGVAAPWMSLGSLYLQEIETGGANRRAGVRHILNDAIKNLLHAIDLNANAAFAHYLLGVAYFKANFYEDAEDSLSRSIELEPRLGMAHLALANVYIALREWPEALKHIDTYLNDNPGIPTSCSIQAIRSQVTGIMAAERDGSSEIEVGSTVTDVRCTG
jgi:hypothetical protein